MLHFIEMTILVDAAHILSATDFTRKRLTNFGINIEVQHYETPVFMQKKLCLVRYIFVALKVLIQNHWIDFVRMHRSEKLTGSISKIFHIFI